MSIKVGEVIAVSGVRITLKIDDDSNKETLFFAGEKYKGISIREYITIQRGFRDIVCMVEGEYLDESRVESEGNQVAYVRKVDVRPIGYFFDGDFQQGVKYMPMIRDFAFLLPEIKISQIFGGGNGSEFVIGRLLKEDVAVPLPWEKVFNTHIGVFGNTGSGKSNTLTKLYTTLLEKRRESIRNHSKFVILDFNGEYSGDQIAKGDDKVVYALDTRSGARGDDEASNHRFPLHEAEFWNAETQSLLFQATQNTQRPFLNRLIEGRARYRDRPESLLHLIRVRFERAFCAGECRSASLDLMRPVARILRCEPLDDFLRTVSWHTVKARFFVRGSCFFDTDGAAYRDHVFPLIDQVTIDGLDAFDELVLRAHLQLIGDLTSGYVQFEHIQPLLKRIDSSLSSLRRIISVGAENPKDKLLTVVSMRRCNNESKKVLPLLIAKHYYNIHKAEATNPPVKTIHLIVDEAHNILSQQSAREHESWKDYRLELFEEIVKEGRKFGAFLTVSSQRPADISPTIVSQLHNFFIHRLVNDRDLFLIDNTISTLDSASRALIPALAKGCCVITGTAFDLPMVMQVDLLAKSQQPDSEDVDLRALWLLDEDGDAGRA